MAIKRKVKRSESADMISLNTAFDDFISEKEATNKSPATVRSYKKTYKKFCDKFGEIEDTQQVTQKLFFKWSQSMLNEGLSPESINHYLRDMRTFMNWCMKDERQYTTPFKVELVSSQQNPPKFYTTEEQQALIRRPSKKADYCEWRSWAICNFILATGARTSSIINLQMKDIDLKKKKITYSHTKNKEAQIIPMSSKLQSVLKEYIRIWRAEATEDDYLFSNIGERQLSDNALRIAFRKYAEDRDVNKTSIHGLRHTFAREFILNDGSMIKLQRLLGHSSLEMTRRYIKLFAEDIEEGFDDINPLDNLGKSSSRKKTIKRAYD